MSGNKKLFLLDAMALIYRAYFALNRTSRLNSKGLNTSAILGFVNTLLDVIKKGEPTHIAVAFDTYGPTIREASFADYKANRQETPEDILLAIPYIRRLIEAFNIALIEIPGYEADDIIGTLARRAESDGFKVFMMTPDKDFGQLVTENIFIYKPARTGGDIEILGVKEVCNRFGIDYPAQVIDILSLWGDSSDNIPGVPGIGEKKARKLIADFGTLENVLKNVDQVAEIRTRENIKMYAEQALLSKKLATIILDTPVEIDIEHLRLKDPDTGTLSALFEELEFRALARRLFENPVQDTSLPINTKQFIGVQTNLFEVANDSFDDQRAVQDKVERILSQNDFRTLQDDAELVKLARVLASQESFCFDTETTGLDLTNTRIVGISFCYNPGQAWYVPFSSDRNEAQRRIEIFRGVFENPLIEKTGQNLKFDIGVLKGYKIEVTGKLFDTMLAHYLLQPDMRHNMDLLAEQYLGYRTLRIEELIGKKGIAQGSMEDLPLRTITAYTCEDVHVTQRLRQVFEPMLSENNLTELLYELEAPLVYVLSEMELTGVKIDTSALHEYSQTLLSEIKTLEAGIYDIAGTKFNVGSPKQLGEILFDRLKIDDKARRTKTRQYSTSEDVLSKMVHKHPIIQKILDYRSLTKLRSTYVEVFPKLINPITGRLHASFNQAVAATGRLSSNNPNLQNIPVRTEKGREIRKAVVAGCDDYILLAADYSQIELRIIAALSKDLAMLEAFREGHDIHAATASKVFGVPINSVTKEMRRQAKAINFGIVYGISPFGLSERLNIPRNEASEIINNYFLKYPGIKKYMEETIAFARKHNYVKTILGRRRYIADINSSNNTIRGYAERNAINSPIQGSAADLIKTAMIKIYNELRGHNLRSKMILQVHDELVFDVRNSELDEVKRIVEKNMKNAIDIGIDLEIEMNTGQNWLEAH